MALWRYTALLPSLIAAALVNAGPAQRPLDGGRFDVPATVQAPGFTRTRQNDSICDAGSAHWTGTVNLGEGRDMFYCEFRTVALSHDVRIADTLSRVFRKPP